MKQFRQFVESLKRLYEDNQVSKEKLGALAIDRKITNEELQYILQVDDHTP